MDAVAIEVIRALFAGAAMILIALVLRPAIKFLRSPMPRLDTKTSRYELNAEEDELQIPNSVKDAPDYTPSRAINMAKGSPIVTAQVVRTWLKDTSHSKSHA